MKKIIFIISFTICIAAGLCIQPYAGHAAKKDNNHSVSNMEFQDGKLNAHFSSAPLNSVMEEFSRLTGVKVLWQDREVDGPVSAGFTSLSPEEAVRNILHGESYLLFYTSHKGGEELVRILILPRAGGQKSKIVSPRDHLGEMLLEELGPDDHELRALIEAGI